MNLIPKEFEQEIDEWLNDHEHYSSSPEYEDDKKSLIELVERIVASAQRSIE